MKWKPSKSIVSRYKDYKNIYIDYKGRLLYINSNGEEQFIDDWAEDYNQEEEKFNLYTSYNEWMESLWYEQKKCEKRGRKEDMANKVGAGRPSKNKDEKTTIHCISLPKEISKWVRDEAQRNSQTISGLICDIVKKYKDETDTFSV